MQKMWVTFTSILLGKRSQTPKQIELICGDTNQEQWLPEGGNACEGNLRGCLECGLWSISCTGRCGRRGSSLCENSSTCTFMLCILLCTLNFIKVFIKKKKSRSLLQFLNQSKLQPYSLLKYKNENSTIKYGSTF